MNCHDLEGIVNDLARGQMMDASLRENARSHAASCRSCGLRLADERALTTGLRGVAAACGEEAPISVETALLSAFREQYAAKPAPVFIAARHTARRWAYAAVGTAAAAIIVMLLWLGGSRSQITQSPVPENAEGSNHAVPPAREPSLSPDTGGQKLAIDKAPAQVRGTPRRIRRSDKSTETVKKPNEPAGDAEIATDFIPLMNRDSLAQLDSGQVMRVELPRSALVSFGLPMNMERADERIKADVVVGNDGLARAIRFVR